MEGWVVDALSNHYSINVLLVFQNEKRERWEI
jgi:hypothetical protein